jgi:thiol-disulfide isomerase/thioredoxin
VEARSGIVFAKAAALGLVCAGLFTALAWRIASPGGRGLQSLSSETPAQLSSFVDETGAPVSVDSFRGKIVILNLWAAWCAPCLQEMPSLDRLAERLPQDEFTVIAVSEDRGAPEVVKRSFARLGLRRLKLYLDPAGKLSKEIGARGMPTTLILSADGKPLSFREGAATWDSEDTIGYLRALQARLQ